MIHRRKFLKALGCIPLVGVGAAAYAQTLVHPGRVGTGVGRMTPVDASRRFEFTQFLPDGFVHSRASAGWYLNSSGLLVEAGVDVPRFDHDASGNALGLLREVARTRRNDGPRDMTEAAWVATNITPLKDATGLDGVANSCSTLTADANNGTILQTVTLGSAEYTYSVYVKRKTGTGTVEITDNNGSNYTDITSEINSTTWTEVTNLTRTQANPVIGFRLGTSGDEIEVDGNQIETGSYSTSRIFGAEDAAVVRAEDFLTSDLSRLPQPVDGVFDITADVLKAASGSVQRIVEMHNGTANERILIDVVGTGEVRLIVVIGGSNVVQITSASAIADNTETLVRVQIAPDNVKLKVGTQATGTDTDTGGVVPAGMNDSDWGQDRGGTSNGSFHFRSIIYTPGARIA